ncbi:MAG: methyltransferase domain-containing protein [Pseudomonadota bacterium]
MSIRVFISYSHDSETHKQMVLEFVNRLRNDGIDAIIDRYINAPLLGWPRWMTTQIEDADYIVCICTPHWTSRFEGKEQADHGKGATWEGMLATQILYEGGTLNRKLIPVVPDEYAEAIPLALRPFTHYRLPTDYDRLYWHITGQPEVSPPGLGIIRKRPSSSTGSTMSPESVKSDGLPPVPLVVPIILSSTDLPQDAKRLRSLQNFALMWALVDQLDGGGWGRSLAPWMHQVWADVDEIRVDASIRTEGGIESACLMVYFLAGAGVPRGKWSDVALSFLSTHRHKRSGQYGTLAELREGSRRILGHPRHTAWAAIAWLSLNELYDGSFSREVNDALVALFCEESQDTVEEDRNPAVLYVLQCLLAAEATEPSAFRLYSPTNDARLAAEWWFRARSDAQLRRAEVSNTDVENRLERLRPCRFAPIQGKPQLTGGLVYPYGGFARMQTYTHLLSCCFLSKATPKSLVQRLKAGLMSVIDWYIEDAGDGGFENPMQSPNLTELRYPLRGVRPFPASKHPDAACTALLLFVLSQVEALGTLGIEDSIKVARIRRMLAWDLIHCFDRFLVEPEYFHYTAATAFASFLLADVRVVGGDNQDGNEAQFARLVNSTDVSCLTREGIEKAVAEFVFYCDGPGALPAQVFSDSVVEHLLNRSGLEFPDHGQNRTAQAYNRCADQFAHMVDGLLNANPDGRGATINNLHTRLRTTFGEQNQCRVLDVGCGPGRHTADMAALGMLAYGVDISEGAINVARDTFPYLSDRFYIGDVDVDATWNKLEEVMPFHGIYAVASLHHIPTEVLDRVLTRIHRALVPGGWVLISLQIGRRKGYDPDGRFVEYYAEGELSRRLTSLEFVQVDSLGLFVVPNGMSTFRRQMTYTFEEVVAQRRPD